MHRSWFFWMERLKISRSERLAVMTLLGISLILTLFSSLYRPSSPYSEKYYAKLDRYFEKKRALIQKKEDAIRARYRGVKAANAEEDERGEKPEKVNINKAGSDALQTLPGIGPALAGRIISYRDTKGAFVRIADLVKVKGIGEATLEKMRSNISDIPDHENDN